MKKVVLSASPVVIFDKCEPDAFYLLVIPNGKTESYYLLHCLPGSSVEFIFLSLSNPSWGQGYHGTNTYGTSGSLPQVLGQALENGHEIVQFTNIQELMVYVVERVQVITTGEVPAGSSSICVKKEVQPAPSSH